MDAFSVLPNDYVGQFLLGVLVTILAVWLLWFLQVPIKIYEFFKRRKVARYISATSFEEFEIIRSLRGYVTPYCMSVDPAHSHELRAVIDATRTPLIDYVDDFMQQKRGKYLIILADCGMGKTSFLINYFHRHHSSWRNRDAMILVSLARASAEDEIKATPPEKRKGTIILLDALDEDPLVLGDHRKRLYYIFELCGSFKAVVITCRSQFFMSDNEIPNETGVVRVGPTRPDQSKEYSLERIYVAPFDDVAINRYLRNEMPGILHYKKRRSALALVGRVPNLAVRPMLLAHISDIVSEGVDFKSQSDIYQAMISAWVKREDRWVRPEPLLKFSRSLAFDLYKNRHERGGEYCKPQEIQDFAKNWKTDIRVEYLTGRSLLNRFSDGNYKFAHRSILEYFVVQAAIAAQSGLELEITDQMCLFLMEALSCADGVSEMVVARIPCIRLNVLSPQVRMGFSVNYSLFSEPGMPINSIALFGMRVTVSDSFSSQFKFADYLANALTFIGSEGGRPFEIRLNISYFDRHAEEVDAHVSMWFEDAVVLSKITIVTRDVASVIGFDEDSVGEVSIVGRPSGTLDLEYYRWARVERVKASMENGFNISGMKNNPSLAIDFKENYKEAVISILVGAVSIGPLSKFGIVVGGSERWLSGRAFFSVRRSSIASPDIGKVIPQEIPLKSRADIWDDRAR